MLSKTFLRRGSPVVLLVLLIALAFLSRSFFVEARRNMKLRRELDKLNTEVSRLEGDSRMLADDLRAFQRPFAIEREARVKYGLRKVGERVLIIPDEQSSKVGGQQSDTPDRGWRGNVMAWWKYFTDQRSAVGDPRSEAKQ